MKRILIATVLALSLLLIPSAASAAGIEVVDKTGDGKWVGDTWEVDLYPGESSSTALALRNSSSSSLEVWVTIVPDSLDNGNVTFELDEVNFIMPPGSNADVTLAAKASGSATPGTYTAELEIKSEIPTEPTPTPSAGVGNGEDPLYPIRTNLFGVEKTYYTKYSGDVYKTIEGTSQDGYLTITVPKRTTALGENGKRLKTLEVAIDEAPPDPPEDTSIIGLTYNFGPAGATFDPPIVFTWRYDPDALPEGVAEEDLVLAYYIDGKWIELECVVDTENNTITASVEHFTTFALMVAVPKLEPIPVPAPAPVLPPAPVVVPAPPPVVVLPPTPIPPTPEPLPEPVPAPIPVPAPVPPIEPEAPSPWGLIIGLIGATVILVCAIWLIKRRRAKE